MADNHKPDVVVAMPQRGLLTAESAEAFYMLPTKGGVNPIRIRCVSSLLCRAFNLCWAQALNLRPDYFAMMHDDVVPEPGWVDLMVAELKRLDADVLSAVIPIKSEKGLTSTAVGTDDPWLQRRLTMHEVYDLPETFGSEDVGGPILLNTGLWVCDFRKPWVEDVCFTILDRITVRDGQYVAGTLSEDWHFSQQLHELGCRLYATRKVKVRHVGFSDYPNDRPWGVMHTDTVYEQLAEEKLEMAHG